jgi:outer membrane protein insertion porin family
LKRVLFFLLLSCGGSKETTVAVEPRPQPTTSTSAPAPANVPTGKNVRVHFEGLTVLTEADLAPVVEIDKPGKNVGASNRDVLERDVLLVLAELYDRGYINGKVEPPRIDIAADGVIDVSFHVEEGVRVRVSTIAVEELDDAKKPVTPLGTIEQAKAGDWFSRKAIIKEVQAINTKYRDAGYAMAEVTPETEIDLAKQSIAITIKIKRGHVMTYGTVKIVPPSATIAVDAAKKAGVTPGARYSETKFESIKKDLEPKGVRVELSWTLTRGKPDAIDATIEVH